MHKQNPTREFITNFHYEYGKWEDTEQEETSHDTGPILHYNIAYGCSL